ncbi:WD40-repeat-containing domain protein [Bipolaris maydis]|nr:WD40-repeat-containing domain protein [Bipolaris maydis]
MRLLKFNEGTKPPYAILSHRWGAEGTEVTFEDLQGNKGEDKLGYEKIRLCGNQAQRDGLRYFWVDTCCINKANKAELSRAIQSMFRWYRDSARCYVYLSDVLSLPLDTTLTSGLQESKVQNSEWFTRGWTLQELLAPSSVEFFSQEWRKLGDRKSLIQEVHEATGIPYLALQGGALSQFNKAYSLAGVVDIDLAPCYGEGVEGAFRRLHDEIDKSTRCIQDLCGTDSRKDKQRIEEMKGGLLKDAYSWIFHNDSYMNWYTDPESRVLWIKGDPGKGKTMLLCGIVNELETSTPMRNTKLVSYFFCQANDPRINSATAVLRGLLYSLVNQQPSLVSCKVFEDANAWITLEDIFADVLQNPDLPPTTHLIIDGLDECVTDLPKLLDFIIRHSSTPRVKWIVSSRNWPEIEDRLEQAGSKAVKFFIEQRVFELAKRNNYDERTQHAVLDHLTLNANDTFLWVALACQHLQVTARRTSVGRTMLSSAKRCWLRSRSSTGLSRSRSSYKRSSVFVAPSSPYENRFCTLCTNQRKTFSLLRLPRKFFPAGQEAVHQAIFARSLQVMSTTLQKDMYGLRAIGTLIEDVKKPKPDPLAAISYSCIYWIDHLCESKPIASAPDPEHLRDGGLLIESLSLCKSISHGIVSMNKLHIEQGERTSLTRLVYDAYPPLQTYISALLFSPTDTPEYISITTAMERHKGIVYSVAFSHDSSPKIWDASSGACLLTLRDHDDTVSSVAFSHNSSRVVSGSHDTTAKIWDTNSGACLLTLSGHSKYVRSVAFSYDSSWIASGSGDFTVKIWNLNNGECIQNLEHGGSVSLVAFFQGSNRLVSAYGTGTGTSIMVWDLNEGKLLKTSGDVDNDFKAALITSDPEERNISVLDLDTGEWLKTLRGQDSAVQSVTFSRNSTQLISGSTSGSIKIWDVTTGECLRTYEGNSFCANSMALSHDSAYLVSGADDGTVRIWDAVSTASLRAPMNHNVGVRSLDFSPDSALLASAFSNNTIKIWHGIENEEIKHKISSMAFSHDSTLLGSGSRDGIIKIWDVSNGKCLHTLVNNGHVRLVVFSQNSACLASVSSTLEGCTSKLWDLSSGKCIQNFTFYDVWRTRGHFGSAGHVPRLVTDSSASDSQGHSYFEHWQWQEIPDAESHGEDVASIAFPMTPPFLHPDHSTTTVKIWDLKRGVCLQTYKTGIWILKMKFENAGPYLRIGIGTINISAALDVSSLSNNSKRCVPRFHGVSLVAQIPRAYRAKTSIWGGGHRIVSGNTIAFASRSGIVSIFKVDVDKLSALEL